MLPDIKDYEPAQFVERDYEFERLAGQDASIMYSYTPINGDEIVYVALEIAPSRGCLHAWETCLISYREERGWDIYVDALDLREVQLIDNPPIVARYFAYSLKEYNFDRVILYWYTRSVFKTESGHQEKWVKLSVISNMDEPGELTDIESELFNVAYEIATAWNPLKEWSFFSLYLARSGPFLLFGTEVAIMMLLIYRYYEYRNTKRRARLIYDNLSSTEDRLILDLIKNSNDDIVNVTDIMDKYNVATNKKIGYGLLLKKIEEAVKNGMLSRKIVNLYDEPYLTWVPLF